MKKIAPHLRSRRGNETHTFQTLGGEVRASLRRLLRVKRVLLGVICLLTIAVSFGCFAAQSDSAAPTASNDVPSFPIQQSPVERFRELLKLAPDARVAALADRNPAIRDRILAKVAEYEALPAAERETRLQQTQLRWLLLDLLNRPAADRANRLAQLSNSDHALVAQRLEQWDHLAPEVQREVLDYEHAIELGQNTPVKPANDNTPPEPPAMPQGVAVFLKLPLDQRKEVFRSFQKFFLLSESEKQHTLAAMTLPQREKAEQALALLKDLPAERRQDFLNQFKSFSEMTEADQVQFLKNSEKWRALSPIERQAWRHLVNRPSPLPPMPPGLALPPPMPTTMVTQSEVVPGKR